MSQIEDSCIVEIFEAEYNMNPKSRIFWNCRTVLRKLQTSNRHFRSLVLFSQPSIIFETPEELKFKRKTRF